MQEYSEPIPDEQDWSTLILKLPNGKIHMLQEHDKVTLGWADDCDVVIKDRHASRKHARIWRDFRGWQIRDLRAKNTTRVDGTKVECAYLDPGHYITIGRTEIDIEVQQKTQMDLPGFLTVDLAMTTLKHQAHLATRSHQPLIITGERGTGKTLLAEAIKKLSVRKDKRFEVYNCSTGASRENVHTEWFGYVKGAFTGADKAKLGTFRSCDGGTVFLDEIGDLRAELQGDLLHLIENGTIRPLGSDGAVPVDVRIITATNKKTTEVLRPDLLDRLRKTEIKIPPLRERRQDIPLLASRILQRYGGGSRFSQVVLDEMMAHPWPGNVRELENFICQYMQGHQVNDDASLLKEIQAQKAEMAKEAVQTTPTKVAAAEKLGVSRPTLYKWLKYKAA